MSLDRESILAQAREAGQAALAPYREPIRIAMEHGRIEIAARLYSEANLALHMAQYPFMEILARVPPEPIIYDPQTAL